MLSVSPGILPSDRKRSDGLLAGAAMGMMSPYGRDPMKTQVGKSIRKLGIAVDNAVDNIVSDLR